MEGLCVLTNASASAPDWHQVEDGFWRSLQATYEAEDKKLADEYKKSKAFIQVTLGELYHERTLLAERMRRVEALCCAEEGRMETLQSQYGENRRLRFAMRDGTVAKMKEWFNHNRGLSMTLGVPGRPLAPNSSSKAAVTTAAITSPSANSMNIGAPVMPQRPASSLAPPSPVAGEPTGEPTGVEICDIDGNVLGPLTKIHARSALVDAVYDRGTVIKRRIMIRPSRCYTRQNLLLLFDPNDPKGGKWAACMIQATGDIQPRSCTTCEKLQGPFEHCVLLKRDGFSTKCANCVWTRQSCHGSSGESTYANGSSAARLATVRSPGDVGTGLVVPASTAVRPVVNGSPVVSSPRLALLSRKPTNGARPVKPIIPTDGTRTAVSVVNNGSSDLLNPAVARPVDHHNPNKRNFPFGDDEEPARGTTTDSGALSLNTITQPVEEDPLAPITLDNLVIKHDGFVYTQPECIRGVPVAKIAPGDGYWDNSWEDLQSVIRPQYEMWLAKQNQILREGGAAQHARFQIGRQVNRGARVLHFLQHGVISPFQLLAKPYTSAGLFTYDTLFRLVNTLDELAQFKDEVPPVEWLRHRLHELIMAQRDNFNLAQVMRDFYRDPKLTRLRKRSGSSQASSSCQTRSGSGSPSATANKRVNTGTDSPRATATLTAMKAASPALWSFPFQNDSLVVAPPPPPTTTTTPSTPSPSAATPPNTVSRAKTEDRHIGNVVADASAVQSPPVKAEPLQDTSVDNVPAVAEDTVPDDDGYATDIDSVCGDSVEPTDFRIVQLKNRRAASDPRLTQYLHWIDNADDTNGGDNNNNNNNNSINNDDDDDEERCLQHQVLARLDPNMWGMYREPWNLSVCVRGIREVRWGPGSLRVVLVLDPRGEDEDKPWQRDGDMLAEFKRHRTLSRFRRFMGHLGIPVTEVSREIIETAWDGMKSELVPAGDEAIDV